MTADPTRHAAPSATATETAPPPRCPVDVLILTYNEEANLPHALRSVAGWANRVFVVDSGSTDATELVAREGGADVVRHPWEGYAGQKNWALDELPFESPWVFILDADEAVTPELRDEIARICARPVEDVAEAGFYVNRYLIFMGARIRHCGYFPSWNLRLFKRGAARYEERPVHEHMVLQGRAGHLKGLLSHEDRRGLEYYVAKHNRYSTLEAETIFFGRDGSPAGVQPRLTGNAVERRRFFKTRIYPHLPLRSFGRFVWMYFIRLGFLDGVAGLRFCLLIASHELFTTLKLRELQYRARSQNGRAARTRVEPTSRVQLVDWPACLPRLTSDEAAPISAATGGGDDRPAAHSTANSEEVAMAPAALMAGARPAREPSPWTFGEKVRRALWMCVRATLFRLSFHNWYAWRRLLLRCFGARVGRGVKIRPSAVIEIPWNLRVGDHTLVGDHAILYSLGVITIGRDVVLSQYAHLCAGTHDYTAPEFPLLRLPIDVADGVWIAADAFVGPGVTVGAGAVVGARATVVRHVGPGEVVAGNPARVLSVRPASIPSPPAGREPS